MKLTKRAIVPLSEVRSPFAVYQINSIMPNLTKHTTRNWTGFQPPPKPENFPAYHHNGTNYRIVPETELKKMQPNGSGILYFSIGMFIAAVAANLGAWLLSRPVTATPQPMIVEKPVVVEREKVVPTNCLAFCK